jgi:hypothetical protein
MARAGADNPEVAFFAPSAPRPRHCEQHRRGGAQFVDAEAGHRRALPHVQFRKGASIESERFACCDTSVNS